MRLRGTVHRLHKKKRQGFRDVLRPSDVGDATFNSVALIKSLIVDFCRFL